MEESAREDELARLEMDPAWRNAVELLRATEPLDASCKVAQRRLHILEELEKLFDANAPLRARMASVRTVLKNTSLAHLSPTKWDDPKVIKEAITALRESLKSTVVVQEVDEEIERSAAELTLALAEECPLALGEFKDAKRAASSLDFDDLQLEALRLLREHPDACTRYREETKAFLIDEFQDTDEIQKEILWRLAGLWMEADADRLANVFVVGDAKQSIYRFRGADVSVFNRTRLEFGEREDSVSLELSTNFRTHQALMAFTNEVFGSDHVMGTGEPRTLYHASYSPLQAERQLASSQPSVDLLFAAPPDTEKLTAEQLRLREADLIARRIRSLSQEKPFEVEEADRDG